MPGTRYRTGAFYAADMAVYARLTAEDNSRQVHSLRRNLAVALRQDITERQRQLLMMYYAQEMNMREIAETLGVDRPTVSRTIKRGEDRLRRCLRYGAASLLKDEH